MKIAVLTGPRRFEIVEEPVPEIAPDEVLVRTAACGVCASELDMWEGRGSSPFPLHPGHEVSGTVASQSAPINTEKTSTLAGVIGARMKAAETTVRAT